ncbi:uncharacterized protein [Dysidea avara]|uniref:uncharacterized protein n=1 Tax=Dysidea avara TaxID=196820 RepID=UPI00331FBBB2
MKVLQTLFLVILPLVSALDIEVTSEEKLLHGNCSGTLGDFLCSCLNTIPEVTFHLLSGDHFLNSKDQCIINNKTKFEMIGMGSTPHDTRISCNNFSLVFMWSENILISNIKMMNCGDFVNEKVNASYTQLIPFSYIVKRTRAVFMFFRSVNTTLSQLNMQQSLGYSMIFLNPFGITNITDVHIENTKFENDPWCHNSSNNDRTNAADYLCTGSGMVTVYVNDPQGFIGNVNNSMILDRCSFSNNQVFYPRLALDVQYQALTTGYFNTKIPFVGEGVFSVYYVQRVFHVTTVVSNTKFNNNNSTICSGVSIFSVSSIESNTSFYNCTFEDNHLMFDENSERRAVGGIGFYFLLFSGVEGDIIQVDDDLTSNIELYKVYNCSFTRLNGAFGAAIHIEKVSPDRLTIFVRIENCLFYEITANRGSALYAIDTTISSLTFSGGSLHIIINNVTAMNNYLSPGTTLEVSQVNDVTGIFFFVNCQSSIICTEQCYFTNNQPSALYGYSLVMRIFGRATFKNNTARFGGAICLHSSVLYIKAGSHIYFSENKAVERGGAIYINMAGIDVKSQRVCPIQFITNQSQQHSMEPKPIFQVSDLPNLTQYFSITFNNNTVNGELQSISSNLFYVCSWFTETLVLFPFDLQEPFVNNTRPSVYHSLFNFLPDTNPHDHIYVLAYVPCLCDEDGKYNVTQCLIDREVKHKNPVIPGHSFNLSIITLDEVGSVAFSTRLYAEVYHTSVADKELSLDNGQSRREFSTTSHSCTKVEFTISVSDILSSSKPTEGILALSSDRPTELKVHFNFSECPVGFNFSKSGCVCSDFFSNVNNDILCYSNTGMIQRVNLRSWFGAIGDDLLYVDMCFPNYCDGSTRTFSLDTPDVLCENNHAGQACGACLDSFSRVFGSDTCKKCDNAWLATIVLYAILGIVLVLILIALKITVTLGIINGLIFFCNVMSINEQLFFNTKRSSFSFLRAFISLINLDLGFEICFYDGMTQLAKSGLQFVFPVYLWLLMMVIIFAHKRISIPAHTVQVFATLFLLSYAKVLHAVVDVLTYTDISSSKQGSILAWRPDPTVSYLTDGHVALFVIALLFLIFFVVPFALILTFPNRFMRYRQMNYFFPLVDCFAAPFKDNYRYWFGTRAVLLIYLALTEAVLFSNDQALLLSNIFAVGFFAFAQTFILPFKTLLSNVLDLLFMGILLILCIATHILYQDDDDIYSAVNVLGYFSFVLFCFIIIYHVYDYKIKHTKIGELLQYKLFQVQRHLLRCKFFKSLNRNHNQDNGFTLNEQDLEYKQYRESFLQ